MELKTIKLTRDMDTRLLTFSDEDTARAALDSLAAGWAVEYGFENIERDGTAVGSTSKQMLVLFAELI